MNVIKKNGTSEALDVLKIQKQTAWACAGLDVSQSELEVACQAKLFDGIKTSEIEDALIVAGAELISALKPGWKYATARILLQKTIKQITGGDVTYSSLRSYIERGIAEGQLDPRMIDFDLEALEAQVQPERDLQFTYLGLQTLVDRYLIRARAEANSTGALLELPQYFFLRVAMGLALREVEAGVDPKAIELTTAIGDFYGILSRFEYMTSTPTLFNAGTTHSQLSSCYLNTVKDSLYSDPDDESPDHHFASIYGTIEECARLSKYAGGIGTDWTRVRPKGSVIKGTNGRSAGTVPYIKVWNDTAIAVNQGGKRNGAFAAYMEPWHPDFPDFIDLRKNSGDERQRAHEIFPAAWIPDLFMQRVEANGIWSFFAPDEFPELHELHGEAFAARYEELEREGKFRDQIEARALWRRMLTSLFETGHPWITFKDAANRRNPQGHVGTIHNSNLCTEITLNTNDNETAVCNLGSVNLVNHITVDGAIDFPKLRTTVRQAVRMLDNVIDINFYPSIRAKNSNLQHRPIGLGVMGMADAMGKAGVEWETKAALNFHDAVFEAWSYYAIEASCDLAEERGSYPTFEGSTWSRGILPIDSAGQAAKDLTTRTYKFDWDALRERVKKGMRNSNVMAVAPTATISNIIDVTPSIEAPYELEYTKKNLSGTFNVVSSALKYGQTKIGFQIDQMHSIECAAVRQKWIDQAQSLNLFVPADTTGVQLSKLYRRAWSLDLKTTYYLRRKTHEEIEAMARVTIEGKLMRACGLDDTGCESCQ